VDIKAQSKRQEQLNQEGRGSEKEKERMGIQSNIRDALLPQPPSFKKKKEYTIIKTLGQGGFGKVVQAHWKGGGEGEGKDVALKYVPILLFSILIALSLRSREESRSCGTAR
jgi:serine/threonine protein kinase